MKKQWKGIILILGIIILMKVIDYCHGDCGLKWTDMIYYRVLDIASCLMLFSVMSLLDLLKCFGNDSDKKFLAYAWMILLPINIAMLIWLLFNKELFHWNYDITGEPVDHYSTYGRCMVYTVIAVVSNIIAGITRLKRRLVRMK